MALGRFALLSLAMVTSGCSQEAPAPAPVVAAPPVEPVHGGTLVTLRSHRVELVAHRSGEVFGYLTRLDGAPVASPEGALLTVTVTIDADHARPVLLQWNASQQRYEARMRAEPVDGPAEVSLLTTGQPERGSTDRLVAQDALSESGVAYAEEAEEEELGDDDEDEPDEAGSGGGGGGRGGGIRARARRLFGL